MVETVEDANGKRAVAKDLQPLCENIAHGQS